MQESFEPFADESSTDASNRSGIALSRALERDQESRHITEEEALARFEAAAKSVLRVSGAGFLNKLKRGEYTPLENHPGVVEVAQLIPPALINRE